MTDETNEGPIHSCEDKECEGACPECGACTHNNGACGNDDCCGPNYNYCTKCEWNGW